MKEAESLVVARMAWDAAVRRSGTDHTNVALGLHSPAANYIALGLFAQAEPPYLPSLAHRESASGPGHTYVAAKLSTWKRTVMLCLANSDGTTIREFSFTLPRTAVESEPEAWASSLPSRAIYEHSITSSAIAATPNKSKGTRGCIAFNYPNRNGYKLRVGSTFNTSDQ